MKDDIKTHWDQNPMNYIDNKHEFSINDLTKDYFAQIDSIFYKKAFFAQDSGMSLFSKIIDYSSLEKKNVLVIGCGLGSITEQLVHSAAHVTAIDLSNTSIEATRKRLSMIGKKNWKVMRIDAEKMEFQDKTFDFVWSWGVIHHTPKTELIVNKVHSMLKPGGKFCMMVYHRRSFHYWYKIILKNGILKGRLLKMSHQELLNYCSDRHVPLAQYFSRKKLNKFFISYRSVNHKTFEPRQMIVGYAPKILRSFFDKHFSKKIMSKLFSRYGHMIYVEAVK